MGLPAGTAGTERHISITICLSNYGFSHVVRYGPRSALGAAMVDSLLDAASHGPAGRWVLLCPTR